ncbi:MAG TPA: DUF4331 family protein, partial [Kofleriaceae bacterium]|nr:DUF4331 family protein [Kofleriaceae bacterium]
LLATSGQAADHVDSPTLTTNPMADITDVYSWMTGSNLNLVMDVSPLDDGSHSFGPSVLYVFHLTSKSGLDMGTPGGTQTQVILKLASNNSVECWVSDATGTKDYVTGDPSIPAGLTSTRGKVKVFAGRRSDPFFFNAAGFAAAVTAINMLPATPPPDGAGCPSLANAAQIQTLLATGPDAFATANVMSIVVQLDKSLVNTGTNTTVAVWGSTHAGS